MWVSRLTKEDRHWMCEHPPVGKGPEWAYRKKVRYVHNHSLTIAFLARMLAHRYKILHSSTFEHELVPCLSRRIPGLQPQTITASFSLSQGFQLLELIWYLFHLFIAWSWPLWNYFFLKLHVLIQWTLIHVENNTHFLTREESQPNENLSIYIAKAL